MSSEHSQENPARRPTHVETIYRQATPLREAKRYPGFKTESILLPRGHRARKGALPLPCDIQADFDAPVRLRDGVTVYIDCYRPTGKTPVPVVLAYAPYGKRGGEQRLDNFPFRMGIGVARLSGLEAFEAADPAWWCEQGYAVVYADARGAVMSEGDIEFWGSRNGDDAHDVIEWLAAQPWCNGRIGMAGNSWLAMIQWFVAASRPPHLAAIAPWEGVADFYRYGIAWGGFPDAEFSETILKILYGNNRIEDIAAMVSTHPLHNDFWDDKRARTERIEVPAYVVSSYTNGLHSIATIAAFNELASRDKWLRIHNTHEWPDFYDPASREDLKRFFDRYLKGIDNGWERTPRVRLAVLDPERTD
ncbi:MAG: CocE/NonD family hydrolase, partial [Rhodocyclaceae bacterium]|nr:CocE/NonD family hydrolase [Rhodocyclaceae bacterium]